MGIADIATSLEQILAPLPTAQIVAISGGYRVIWVATFGLVILTAVALFPVRGVR